MAAFGGSLFGSAAPATPGAFGAPAAGGGAFGAPAASSTPSLFGAPAASTPSLFGAPAASAPASTGLFGAPTSGGAFGAPTPASTPSLFGTPAPAASSTPSLFGAASTPGLFGAAQTATPQSTPSMFGATGGGMFGSMQTGAFGAAAAPTPGTPSIFGGTPGGAFGSTPGGAFGAPAPAPVPGGDLAAVRELQGIEEGYRQGGPQHAFTSFFLNVVDNPALRGRPPNVDSHKWREAMKQAGGENNPEKLWPVQAVGFGHLLERRAAQEQAIAENEERLAQLRTSTRQISRKHELDVQERMQGIIRRQQELCHRLLHVMRAVDGAEGRLAASMGSGFSQGTDTREQQRRLAAVESAVAPSSAGGLQRQVEALASAARLRAGGVYRDPAKLRGSADEESMRQMFNLLEQHVQMVRKLQEVLVKDERDMHILAAAEQQVGRGQVTGAKKLYPA